MWCQTVGIRRKKAFYNWTLRGIGWDDDWGFNSRHQSDLTTSWLHEASAATAIVSLPSNPYLIKQPPAWCTDTQLCCAFMPLYGWLRCIYKPWKGPGNLEVRLSLDRVLISTAFILHVVCTQIKLFHSHNSIQKLISLMPILIYSQSNINLVWIKQMWFVLKEQQKPS